MPQLNSHVNLEKFFLPSYEYTTDANGVTTKVPEGDQGWVVMNTGDITAGDVKSADSDNPEGTLSIKLLTARIVEWNLNDADGRVLPIVFENVALLKMQDYKFLGSKLNADNVEGLSEDDLKASSSTSPTVPPTDIQI